MLAPVTTDSASPARRIGLFGGTFDPVHLGHIHLAGLARDALRLDEIRFIPCRISPHKSGGDPASAADRLAMLEIATRGMPWAVVDDSELTRPGPSFSYRTAEEMAGKFPGARLFWIMGGDQWRALPKWERPERLAAAVEFAVLPRGGPVPEPRPGFRLHVIPGGHPASATAIRAGNAPDFLDPAVAAWISDHGIYRSGRE